MNRRSSNSFRRIAPVAASIFASVSIASGDIIDGRLDVVAHVGQATPAGETTFVNITDSSHGRSLNEQGRVVFTANLDDGVSSGLYAWENGVTTELVRSGDPAPVAGTFLALHLGRLQQNDVGGILFWAFLDGTPRGDDDNAGIYWYQDGEIKEIVRKGDALPIDSNAEWNGFTPDSPAINNQGHVLLALQFNDSQESDAGLFLWDGNGLTKVVRNGDPVPADSTIGNTVFSQLGFGKRLQLNDSGEIAFTANNRAVYRGMPDALSEVAVPTSNVEGLQLNNDGLLVFTAALGLFSQTAVGEEVQTLYERTDPAIEEGDTFSSFQEVKLTQSGLMAFQAGLTTDGGFRSGLFRTDGVELTQIFRAAAISELGGLPAGTATSYTEFTMNETGLVSIEANLLGNGNNGLIISDGETSALLFEGPNGIPNGRPRFVDNSNFNAVGQLFFEATVHTVPDFGRATAFLLYTPETGNADAPELMITKSENTIELTWPSDHTGFDIESRSTLADDTDWAAESPAITEEDGFFKAEFPIGSEANFFRLTQ